MIKQTTYSHNLILKSYILLLCLASIRFFNPIFLAQSDLNYLNYIYLIFLMLPILYYAKNIYIDKNNLDFFKLIKYIILSVFLSMVSSFLFWNQTLFQSFVTSLFPVFGYFTYFFLIKKKPSIKIIEQVIFIIGALYIILYSISFYVFPNNFLQFQLFGDDRGFQRIILVGNGFQFLFFFMCLNKLVQRKKKILWLTLCVISLISIIMSLERLYIVSCTIISIIYLMQNKNIYYKLIILTISTFTLYYIINLDFVKNFSNKTKDEISYLTEYVRIQSLDYYMNDFNNSLIVRFIGNGFAYKSSSYGIKMVDANNSNLWVEDLGFIGLYFYLGVIPIVCYILIFRKIFFTKMDANLIYVKLFFSFIVFNSLTANTSYSESFLMCIILCMYVFETKNFKNIHYPVKINLMKHHLINYKTYE